MSATPYRCNERLGHVDGSERPEEISDASLVQCARRGQEWAFECLMVRHEERIRRNIASIVRGADQDDVNQRGWLKIYRKLDTLREPRLFGAWANRVVTNEALGFVRKAARRRTQDLDELLPSKRPVDEGPDNEELASWRELLEQARGWFGELEKRDQRMFYLYLVEGMTMDEISDEVGMSSGGVKVRIHRARKSMKVERERAIR